MRGGFRIGSNAPGRPQRLPHLIDTQPATQGTSFPGSPVFFGEMPAVSPDSSRRVGHALARFSGATYNRDEPRHSFSNTIRRDTPICAMTRATMPDCREISEPRWLGRQSARRRGLRAGSGAVGRDGRRPDRASPGGRRAGQEKENRAARPRRRAARRASARRPSSRPISSRPIFSCTPICRPTKPTSCSTVWK